MDKIFCHNCNREIKKNKFQIDTFGKRFLCEKCTVDYFSVKEIGNYRRCYELDTYERMVNNDRH